MQNIFNPDEFVFFQEKLPDKTLELKGEKCTGGKHSKVIFTEMNVTSAADGKLPEVVTGKSKTLRGFKNVKSLSHMYQAQTKNRMDSEIFTD